MDKSRIMGKEVTVQVAMQKRKAGSVDNRPVSVYCFPRRALALCPQLCMGTQPDARFPARSADALPATLYRHFTPAIYRNRPIAKNVLRRVLHPHLWSRMPAFDVLSTFCRALVDGPPILP